MHEVELKFFVPDHKLDAMKRQTHIKSAKTTTLEAHYFDTSDGLLAKQGMALRIRKEGERWVQTIKASGNGLTSRVELNHYLDTEWVTQALTQNQLLPDLTVYQVKKTNTAKTNVSTEGDCDNSDANANKQMYQQNVQQIAKQLSKIQLKIDHHKPKQTADISGAYPTLHAALLHQYVTSVQRTKRLIKKDANVIEVAFDVGEVIHGQDVSIRQNLQEVEFELLQGDQGFLFDVVTTWCKRYQLRLSTITKAERGGLLLAGQSHSSATKANIKALSLDPQVTTGVFLQKVVHNCLMQILPNASAIADGSKDGNHVHQLRVGLRRLRTGLKYFAKFDQTVAIRIQNEWLPVIKHTFGLLGEYRDKEVLKLKTQPMLEQVGGPQVHWDTDVAVMPIDAVSNNSFQLILLDMMAFAVLPVEGYYSLYQLNITKDTTKKAKKTTAAKPKLEKTLNKLFSHIATASSQFADLELEAQHDVRKNLKRLRYVCEFASPIYRTDAKKAMKQFLRYLEPAQDVLGDYNDNLVAHDFYLEKTKTDAKAWFAVGWFLAREKAAAKCCAVSLTTVKDAPIFWGTDGG